MTTSTVTSVLDPEVFKPVTDLLSGSINVAGIVTILVACLGISLVFVGLWWGVRKALKAFFGAFRKGRANV